jgi:hypothetical protein
VNANVAVNGRLLARNGTVTLISDIITRSTCATVTPTVAPVPTATPQLPNTALDEGVEMVVLSPLFAIIGVIALTTLVARRSVVRASRPSAGKEQPGGRID